ncbi:hypothetical protein HELRODRAFT_175309 [Helobdella robusta]|uniref:BRICHOS domain-containing protein n=1 Tax=Helobdella robusta TaxID=6412 RepID=T1F948_HELRO|nr:hypothetical protein HELRODRAFT_175309 [Helobdella robusta]ESO00821.1 hypothetical protein HELRODRAFT_175309 [Helobdella robusta]
MKPELELGSKETPAVVFVEPPRAPKLTERKYFKVGIIVSIVLLAVLIICAVAGILAYIGVQNKLIEYKLTGPEGRTQEVSGDLTENVVKYHIQDSDQDAWVVNDFNTDIKVTKIVNKMGTNCYVSPLNRSNAMEPAKITVPKSSVMQEPSDFVSIVFKISGEPIGDISFMNKKAKEMCKGLSTYWMYPTCAKDDTLTSVPKNPANSSSIQKRAAPFYVYSTYYYRGLNYPCFNACCRTICAPYVSVYSVLKSGVMQCYWVTSGTRVRDICYPTPGLVCRRPAIFPIC